MATQTVEATDHKLLAAGEWQETGEWGEVKSPYDGSVVGRVAQGDEALVERAIEAAHEAFESADFPQHERAASARSRGRAGRRAPRRPGGDDRRRGRQADQDGDGRGRTLRLHARVLRGRGAQADRRHGADGRRRRPGSASSA